MVRTVVIGSIAFLVSLAGGFGVMFVLTEDAVDLPAAMAASAGANAADSIGSDVEATVPDATGPGNGSVALAQVGGRGSVVDPDQAVELTDDEPADAVKDGPVGSTDSDVNDSDPSPSVASSTNAEGGTTGSGDATALQTVGESGAPQADSALPEGRLGKIFAAMQPREAARVLEQMEDRDVSVILGMMNDRQAAAVLANLAPERAARISKSGIGGGVR